MKFDEAQDLCMELARKAKALNWDVTCGDTNGSGTYFYVWNLNTSREADLLLSVQAPHAASVIRLFITMNSRGHDANAG